LNYYDERVKTGQAKKFQARLWATLRVEFKRNFVQQSIVGYMQLVSGTHVIALFTAHPPQNVITVITLRVDVKEIVTHIPIRVHRY
jgi:hypothetical protein